MPAPNTTRPSLHRSPFYLQRQDFGVLLTGNRLSSLPSGPGLADSRNLTCQYAYFLFKLLVFVAAIGKSRAQAGVKLARSRSPRNFRDIDAADSCSRYNGNPFPRGFDKFGERRGSF